MRELFLDIESHSQICNAIFPLTIMWSTKREERREKKEERREKSLFVYLIFSTFRILTV